MYMICHRCDSSSILLAVCMIRLEKLKLDSSSIFWSTILDMIRVTLEYSRITTRESIEVLSFLWKLSCSLGFALGFWDHLVELLCSCLACDSKVASLFDVGTALDWLVPWLGSCLVPWLESNLKFETVLLKLGILTLVWLTERFLVLGSCLAWGLNCFRVGFDRSWFAFVLLGMPW